MKRQNYHTQWAAQFAIAAELSRRGYTVALSLGSAKTLDILCTAPSGRAFRIEAKGTTNATFIRTGLNILEMDLVEDLFLVVALVPADEFPFRFFVLTLEEIRQERLSQPQTKRSGEAYVPGHDGLRWAAIQKHESRWDKLPE
jgi:hypothetical protein